MFASSTTKTRRIAPSHQEWVPHTYQDRAVDFLIENNRAALFLDPGLGKTSITLQAFCELQDAGQAEKMLVIAPLRPLKLVWRQEARKWSQFRHLRFAMLHGNRKGDALREDADVYLINPEGVPWLSDQYFGRSLPFDTVVFDELTKFKNSRSERSKRLRPRLSKVPRRWGLTGTPTPNGYMDLFGQMLVLDDGQALGRYITHYRASYFEQAFDGHTYYLRHGAQKKIEARIRPYVLRMAANDYLELPQIVDDIHTVEMPAKARKHYEKLKRDMIAELDEEGVVTAGNSAAVYSKLKQMANGAVYIEDELSLKRKVVHIHDAKVEALQELVEELQGTPILIAYEFQHDLTRLLKALGKNTAHIGRGVSDKEASRIEREWNEGKINVLLAHPASAGHGLNLQSSNAQHIAWFSQTWDYELYDQFIRRVVRQGNKSARVINHIFTVENTLDSRAYEMLETKGATQAALLNALNAELFGEKTETRASRNGAEETTERNMARKLSRKSQVEEQEPEEDEEETEGTEEDEDEEETPKPRRRSTRRTKASEDDDEPKQRRGTRRKLQGRGKAEDDEDEDEEETPKLRARQTFSKKTRAKLEGDDEDEEETPKPTRRRRSKAASDDDEGEGEAEAKPTRRRASRKKAEPEAAEPEAASTDSIDYAKLAKAVVDEIGRRLT